MSDDFDSLRSNRSESTVIESESTPQTPPPRRMTAGERWKRASQLAQMASRMTILSLENQPCMFSRYDDRYDQLVNANPSLLSNRVHIPWYRRYFDVLPEEDQIIHQPYQEIQTRDEDIALQHIYDQHECMHDNVYREACTLPPHECKKIRTAAMSRYTWLMKREQEKKYRMMDQTAKEDNLLAGQNTEIDYTTEFGFSVQKKNIVNPVVEFLMKLHLKRNRMNCQRTLKRHSKWKFLQKSSVRSKIQRMVQARKRQMARNRIRRVFNLVFCVHRFIKCVAMIAGDTQRLLKDNVKQHQLGGSDRHVPRVLCFDAQRYKNVGQANIPFHIQMILSKPWFCRSNKEVDMTVCFLDKMRCFTMYPRQFQYILARCAWYIEIPPQKVIIRQCQEAVNFYLLLSGHVKIERLVGSPEEDCGGTFRTLARLTSQDMFGDECITAPFSLRTYTATSEEKCAMLDFNMYDYNGMIQTANLSEEAPDHIRFICKLRFMDKFPKKKLLQEQDDNITYFYFRPGMLLCPSVRESPFIFIIRNGKCSLLKELVPKKDGYGLRSTSSCTLDRWSYGLDDDDEAVLKPRPSAMLQSSLSHEDKQWFEKTKVHFEDNKVGLSDQVKDVQLKVSQVEVTLTTDVLNRLNIHPSKLDESDHDHKQSERVSTDSSQCVRWVDENFLTETPSTSDVLAKDKVENGRRRSKIVGSNIDFSAEAILGVAKRSLALIDNVNNSAMLQRYNGILQRRRELNNKFKSQFQSQPNPIKTDLKKKHRSPKLPPVKTASQANRNQSGLTVPATSGLTVPGQTDKRSSYAGSDKKSSYAGSQRRNVTTTHGLTVPGQTDARSSYAGSHKRNIYAGSERRSVTSWSDKGSSYAGSDGRGIKSGSDIGSIKSGSDGRSINAGSDRRRGKARSDRGSSNTESDESTYVTGSDSRSFVTGSDRRIGIAGTDRGDTVAGTDKKDNFGRAQTDSIVPSTDRRGILAGADRKSILAGTDRKVTLIGTDRKGVFAGTDRKGVVSGKNTKSRIAEKDKKSALSRTGKKSMAAGQDKKSMSVVPRRKSVAAGKSARYSRWCETAVLSVTDVVGNDWLDYNDGNYHEPTEDCSLVSHGATVILIKKEFMLKHLRKVW